ncbi:MAG: LysR family transcriptional regulator [Gammaproteobacteria bacterium]|nr:LysR family transcriptional regulator [Gammaproteobacteria bacterium]
MTLTELRYIVAVARVKHFGKAADECFVSQPTLSVGIRKLEDSLGIAIFERGRSEVRITPIGQAIITRAQNALAETEAIKNLALADQHQLREPIKFGSIYTLGQYLYPAFIKQIYNFSPELSVSLSQDYHEKLLMKLLNKELDIILLSTTNNQIQNLKSPELCYQPILQEELYILAAKSHKHSESENLSSDMINSSDLLLLNKQHCLRNECLSINPNWSEDKDNVKEPGFNSLESMHDNVVLESGLAIIPAVFSVDLKQKQNDQVKVISFNNNINNSRVPTRILSLVWRNDFPRMQALDTVRHALKNIDILGLSVIL